MSADHRIALEVLAERERQDEKWGKPHDQPDGTGPSAMPLYDAGAFLDDHTSAARLAQVFTHRTDARAVAGEVTLADILLEEVFEALAESEPAPLRTELVQVAAVCVKWVRILDERAARGTCTCPPPATHFGEGPDQDCPHHGERITR